jgi:hypothetical protein
MAAVLLGAWAVALAGLVNRDIVRTSGERMAELALRVNPGNVFYAVEQEGRHIGYASSTIDTLADTLVIRDLLVADLAVAGKLTRTTARTQINMTRSLALRSFIVDIGTAATPVRVSGRAEGDTSIAYVMESNGVVQDTQRVRVNGPIVLPTLLPLAAILRDDPHVGGTGTFRTFDPSTLASKDVTLEIVAESLFTVVDSAQKDIRTNQYVPALRDTVRAWRLATKGGTDFTGWVDAQGRIVETAPIAGLRMRRMAYEIAFENWRAASPTGAGAAGDQRDILTATAIASNVALPANGLAHLKVRLTAPSLKGFDLAGGRQALHGDTVTISREGAATLEASYRLMQLTPEFRTRFRDALGGGPGIQARVPLMVRTAMQIVRTERDPRAIVERIMNWMRDSVRKEPTISIPDALQVLGSRRGDCNEHAQLFTALARAMDVPTRVAAGLAYVNGKFYYHAWAEVYLDDWVAVDPTFGQFPADAAHVRLVIGGLDRQAQLLQLIGTLHIEVLEAR